MKQNTTESSVFQSPPQRELAGALIGLARAVYVEPPGPAGWQTLLEGLTAGPEADTAELLSRVRQQKAALAPGCAQCAAPCGRTADCDLALLDRADPATRSLKLLLLQAACSMAGRALSLEGPEREELEWMVAKTLFAIGEDWGPELLAPLLSEAERLPGGAEGSALRGPL